MVIWRWTYGIGAREKASCRHVGYFFRLAARVLLYAPSHRQNSTYNSHGALAGKKNSSMGPPCTIDPTTHRTMSERSYHGATSRSLFSESTLRYPVSCTICVSVCTVVVFYLDVFKPALLIIFFIMHFSLLTRGVKNPYDLKKNPYKLSTPLQNTILV